MFVNKITPKMIDYFTKRQKLHVNLVRKYLQKIFDSNLFDLQQEEIIHRMISHDVDKFDLEEYEGYVYVNWKYFLQKHNIEFKTTKKIEDLMHNVTLIHIKKNRHYPEFHSNFVDLNRKNRDELVNKIIDGTKMNKYDIAEMVSDWVAVSEERNTNTPYEWAQKNINVRWKFTQNQIKLIYKILDYLNIEMKWR